MPASSRSRSNTLPAGPTNGLPAMSSWSPGCSPTKTTRGVVGPFAEHGLGRIAPQRAAAAALGGLAQFGDRSRRQSSGIVLHRLRAPASAWPAPWRDAAPASSACCAIMSVAALSAPAIRPGMSDASGRFRQYFFGISACIAFTFSRAGLKMFCEIGAPQRFRAVVGRRVARDARRADRQRSRRPSRAERMRRQDRPAHAGEAAHEETALRSTMKCSGSNQAT